MLASFEVEIYDRSTSSSTKKDAQCGTDSHGDTIKRFPHRPRHSTEEKEALSVHVQMQSHYSFF